MDTRLLKHYESELLYLRDMGAEFAAAFPKIASRLGMEGMEVADPYVERLLEGVAFLTARVQLELDLQYPTLTNNLLEIVYPHYLAPTPSMMIAALEVDRGNSAAAAGYMLPRETVLRSRLMEGEQTACEFRTAADLTVWPLEVTEAEYIESRGELAAAGLVGNSPARAGIRLRLKRTDDGAINELPLENLTLYLSSTEGNAWLLLELLCSQSCGITGRSTDRRDDWKVPLRQGALEHKGFEPEEALLPLPRRTFDGYRLLQEFFAMPQRFLFVELQNLQPAFAKATGADIDIYVLLKEGMSRIGPSVVPSAFMLNAVPAVNLFPKRLDRVHLSKRDTDQHVVANRTAPLDFEIHTVTNVTGISGDGSDDVPFRPFYSATHFTASGERHPAYYAIRRRMRQRSEKERLRGVRTSYLGSEVYLSLVDKTQAPYPADLDQLAVQALCTNRDLPLLLVTGDDSLFQLPEGGPITRVKLAVPPTRPHPTLAQGDTAWRLISHLSLNYASIADENNDRAAAALRELVGLYAPLGDRVTEKQLEGLVSVSTRRIVRRMSDEVLSTAVRGMEITIGFDESFFDGASVFVMGAVLERFFRKYANINSFTETVLTTDSRGEIARWQPKVGLARMI